MVLSKACVLRYIKDPKACPQAQIGHKARPEGVASQPIYRAGEAGHVAPIDLAVGVRSVEGKVRCTAVAVGLERQPQFTAEPAIKKKRLSYSPSNTRVGSVSFVSPSRKLSKL